MISSLPTPSYETMANDIAHAKELLQNPKIHDFKSKDGKRTRQELREIVSKINEEIANSGAISEESIDALVQTNWDIMNLDNEIEERNRKKPSLWQRIRNLFFPKDRHIATVPLFTHASVSKVIATSEPKEKPQLLKEEKPATPSPPQPQVVQTAPAQSSRLAEREDELRQYCNKPTDPKTNEAAKEMLQALKEFPGERDLQGMFCLVSDKDGQFQLHYLDLFQRPKEKLLVCQADGKVIIKDEKEKKEETFESFADVKIALKLSERRTTSLLVDCAMNSIGSQQYFAEEKTKQQIDSELQALPKVACFILWQEEGTKNFYVSSRDADGQIEHILIDTLSVPGKAVIKGEVVPVLPPLFFEKLARFGKSYSQVLTELRTHELYEKFGEPLPEQERKYVRGKLESIKKELGDSANGAYFMVRGPENSIELVFLDDHGLVRSGPLEMGPRGMIFDNKEFSSANLRSFYHLYPLENALFQVAFANLHFISDGEREKVIADLEKDVQTFREKAEGAYTLFSEGGAFFLAYVHEQKVKIEPLIFSLHPESCSLRNDQGKLLPLLSRVTFKNVDECREHFQRHAKEAGIVVNAKLNVEAEREIIRLRKRHLLEAAGEKMKEDFAKVEAEFTTLVDALTPDERKGAFIVLPGSHEAEMKIKVATAIDVQELTIDLGLERGKYKVKGKAYTLQQLKDTFHLKKTIKDLRSLRSKSK